MSCWQTDSSKRPSAKRKNPQGMIKVKLGNVVGGEPKAHFSKATTPMCRGGVVVLSLDYSTLPLKRTLYVVPSRSFQTFFVQAFKIVVDSWKFTMLLLYILWDDWPIFRISASNEQLQQQLEYTLLKPDCHRWWISKMQSGLQDTLEERYAIKFCFKLRKQSHGNVWNTSDCFSTILHESSISFWVA